MADRDHRQRSPRPRLKALRDFFLGAESEGGRSGAAPPAGAHPPKRIGRYHILHKLGQGGAGVVYAARDERLERTVAIKTILGLADNKTARKRFWREAKTAASVNHPNICQLYEIGEERGALFIAMELLDGEPLSDRLAGGALVVDEAVAIALGILSALTALHGRGIVHRDLKPSNVFLTPHGVKVLDFGLALPVEAAATSSLGSLTGLTRSGVIVGTPRYMAPEQVTGEELGFRTDLFAAGAILFEMLAGQPAFGGKTVVEVLYATLHEQPPALSGAAGGAAADRVLRKALAKAPKDRHATAEAMAADLRAVLQAEGTESSARARALTRLVVLPFRALRPDPDTDFLTFSLPDAIATSLSGLPSLVVRSSAAAARFATAEPDFKVIAVEADVDRVLTGTLHRSGDQLRVSTQLVETPAGTLVWSHTAQSALGDMFALQDDLARRIVEALALPLSATDAGPRRDVPASARAYEFYLRANEVSRNYKELSLARDLYVRCLEEDSRFAPAWARLGRCHRLIGKYFMVERAESRGLAEAAFKRALELNPELALAHKYYAHLEAEMGRAPEAMTRLLRLARDNRNDPEIFAGLVHSCRYSGLFEASLAAHREARRLEPHVRTSVPYSLLLLGDYEGLLTETRDAVDADSQALALWRLGREAEASKRLREAETQDLHPLSRQIMASIRICLEGSRDEGVRLAKACIAEHGLDDPEALFLLALPLAFVGALPQALDLVERAVRGGYYVAPALARDPVFDPLRIEPAFRAVLAQAEEGRRRALTAFRHEGGEGLVGAKPN